MPSVRMKLAAGVAALGIAGVTTAAVAHDRAKFRADLNGYEEVPAVSTQGVGTFRAQINRNADEIRYSLAYAGQFNDTITQAHIHFGQPNVNGGITVWLCANNPPITTAPAGTQPCPAPPTTITGTIRPENVVGPAGQGIAPGEFAELVQAMRAGLTYANIHSLAQPGGEVRGQIGNGDGRD
jgi:CHRD domain